jgi:hypothetical protein
LENNVYVRHEVLEAMRQEAQVDGKDVNGLFEEAAERLLAHKRLDELAVNGRKYARALGPKQSLK